MKYLISLMIAVVMLFYFESCQGDEHAGHDHAEHEEHSEQTEDEDHSAHEDHEEAEEHGEHEEHSEQAESEEEDGHEGHDDESLITFSDEIVKELGVKISYVSKRKLKKLIKLPGEIVPDQDTLQHIYPRFSGLVLKVYKKNGDKVGRGDVLALVQNNDTLSTFKVTSLLSGTIIRKHITVGEVVKPENEIYRIANLSRVWVHLDVYAKDASYLKVGQKISIETIGSKIKTEGRISYISPVFNENTRSLTARIVLQNKQGKWRPGTFVKGYNYVESSKEVLAIRKDGVQIVDQNQVVFVPVHKNSYQSVDIVTGEHDSEFIQIKSGLKNGDQYISKGSFEIKAKMVTSSMDPHAGHGH